MDRLRISRMTLRTRMLLIGGFGLAWVLGLAFGRSPLTVDIAASDAGTVLKYIAVAMAASGVSMLVTLWVLSCRAHSVTRGQLHAIGEMRQARAAAEAASRAKSEFLANMSHEIRTPMTAILGYAELLSDEGQPLEQRRACLDTIRRSGEHVLTIINEILDLSKIEAGGLAVQATLCSPAAIAGDVASLLAKQARDKQIRLEVACDGPVPSAIQSDPLRLRQLLINLVGNAVKFTQNGSVRITLCMDGPQHLRIDVADTGIGISPEELSGLFQPFAQAEGAQRFGGTGLGLAISSKLAALLGGQISARSIAGEGSTFTLTIPTGSLDGVEMVDSLTTEHPRTPAPQLAAPRLEAHVLLAEDALDSQRLVAMLLTRAGARVEVAQNGKIAMEKALKAAQHGAPFDLILMDMQMPEVDGYEATRSLRERGYRGAIVALTAHAMPEDRARCLAAGCDDFATKPIDAKALIARCAQWAKLRAKAA
jgi:signal transduction histidine kinase/CheY-like chemotaxis protein